MFSKIPRTNFKFNSFLIKSSSRSFTSSSIVKTNNADVETDLNINNNHDKVLNSNEEEFSKIQLPNIERLNAFNKSASGIPGLLSQPVLQDIWFKQISSKLEDLKFAISESVYKNDFESCFSKDNPYSLPGSKNSAQEFILQTTNKVIDQYHQLLIKTAKKPDESFTFQSVSTIYNLFYYLSSLKSNNSNSITKSNSKELLKNRDIFSETLNKPSDPEFLKMIEKSFGSLEEFKTLFLSSAKAIKGNGYTWLVYRFVKPHVATQSKTFSANASLVVLNTYNNGTPHHFVSGQITTSRDYIERRKRQSSPESATEDALNFTDLGIPSMEQAQDKHELFEFAYKPLVSVGMNPSFYLRDYGVYGKDKYLENVWNCIDWNLVEDRYTLGVYSNKRK